MPREDADEEEEEEAADAHADADPEAGGRCDADRGQRRQRGVNAAQHSTRVPDDRRAALTCSRISLVVWPESMRWFPSSVKI